MDPEPTVINSLDYLVELSDDAKQPDQHTAEVVLLPPTPPPLDGSHLPPSAPKPAPQS
jgi:hypothetical protein